MAVVAAPPAIEAEELERPHFPGGWRSVRSQAQNWNVSPNRYFQRGELWL